MRRPGNEGRVWYAQRGKQTDHVKHTAINHCKGGSLLSPPRVMTQQPSETSATDHSCIPTYLIHKVKGQVSDHSCIPTYLIHKVKGQVSDHSCIPTYLIHKVKGQVSNNKTRLLGLREWNRGGYRQSVHKALLHLFHCCYSTNDQGQSQQGILHLVSDSSLTPLHVPRLSHDRSTRGNHNKVATVSPFFLFPDPPQTTRGNHNKVASANDQGKPQQSGLQSHSSSCPQTLPKRPAWERDCPGSQQTIPCCAPTIHVLPDSHHLLTCWHTMLCQLKPLYFAYKTLSPPPVTTVST